jgi:hypothetical protein
MSENELLRKPILKGCGDCLQLALLASELCLSPNILNQNKTFRELDVLPPSGEGYLLGWVRHKELIPVQ